VARTLSIAAVQAAPLVIGAPLGEFRAAVESLIERNPALQLVVYPELHLFGSPVAASDTDRVDQLRASAEPLDGPLCTALARIAADLGIWLIPGSVCELGPGGELFNTAVVFSPTGALVASYRKIFPWRPFEPYDPGDRFVVFDIDGIGRLGLDICYDAWFPEVSRHLAWMGAEVIVNVVKTTTPDRAQELVLARANSIVNQVFMVSVNTAGPEGRGESILVDPEGAVIAQAPDAGPTVLLATLDLELVTRAHDIGTAGINRMWSQFAPGDRPIELPLYGGRIDPARWHPPTPTTAEGTP
jgi:predicted amidohydrolase